MHGGVTATTALGQAPNASAPPPAFDKPSVLRLGITHPQPRLCAGQEPSQRDLRVLRLAFGLHRPPTQRLEWPWYLTPVAPGARDLALDTQRLWGVTWPTLAAADGRAKPIVTWLRAVTAQVPGLEAAPPATGGMLRVRSADALLPSRLAGHEWLPDVEAPGGNGISCRRWPLGVEYHPGGGREAYTLRQSRPVTGPDFVLHGYRQPGALWADLSGDRLDAALVEGADLGTEDPPAGLTWGQEVGTQQIVLRFHPAMTKALPAEARLWLSQAIHRGELAQLAPRGGFQPARAFTEAVQPSRKVSDHELFQWDSRSARQHWLEHPPAVQRLRIAVLSHPFLESLAQRLAGNWQKSLELPTAVQPYEADRLWRAWQRGEVELMVDVVDLDDGSLQDLWGETLGAALHGKDAAPAAWEQRLRAAPPYLPLLTHVQWVVSATGPETLARACPGCAIAAPPP